MNDRGQMHTLEGLAAAILVITSVMFISRATVIVTPQIELSLDAQLKQLSNDALIQLDSENLENLKGYVAAWNGTEAKNLTVQVSGEIKGMETRLDEILPDNVAYDVNFVYWNNGLNTTRVIMHGVPPDNSIIASRLVTLHSTDSKSSYWTGITDLNPRVVEVRLITWYI